MIPCFAQRRKLVQALNKINHYYDYAQGQIKESLINFSIFPGKLHTVIVLKLLLWLVGFAMVDSAHKGVNQPSKYATQAQQQRPESPTVTLTWHACKYKVQKLHQRYILR